MTIIEDSITGLFPLALYAIDFATYNPICEKHSKINLKNKIKSCYWL
jgi:hypothetical protein